MIQKKLSSAATVAGLFSVASETSAVIQVNTNGFIVGDNEASQFDWDIDGDGGRETRIAESVSGPYNSIGNSLATIQFGFQVSNSRLVNLPTSVYVGAGNTFRNFIGGIIEYGAINIATGFTSGETGYIGFQFDSNGTTVYGWAEVVLTNTTVFNGNGNFEVIEWAYQDDGSAIRVGTIPEPANATVGLGLLALGAAGLRRWRRSRETGAPPLPN
ncbi:MAG: hypothetical protein AAGJ81_13595 [Verrucomicrobiota bacterium]